MKNTILVSSGVLLALFAVITFLKTPTAPVHTGDGGPEQTEAEQAHVKRFWDIYRQATAHRMAGRLADAATAYREALSLNNKHEDALYYLGHMLQALGEFAEARNTWERLLRLNPNSARAHTQLGSLHFCIEQEAFFDLNAAEAAFTRARELNKEETGPLLQLSRIALVRGDLTRAYDYLDDVLGSNNKSVEAYFVKGYIAWKQKNIQEATASFAQATAYVHPQEPSRDGLGEGDTKLGVGSWVSGESRCRGFQSAIDSLIHVPLPEMDQHYQNLDMLLDQTRTAMKRLL